MTTHIWNLIEERKQMKAQTNYSRTKKDLQTKKCCNSEILNFDKKSKQNARGNKRKWVDELANQAEEANGKGDLRELYKITSVVWK